MRVNIWVELGRIWEVMLRNWQLGGRVKNGIAIRARCYADNPAKITWLLLPLSNITTTLPDCLRRSWSQNGSRKVNVKCKTSYHALILKLLGTSELRNRDPIGTRLFMIQGPNRDNIQNTKNDKDVKKYQLAYAVASSRQAWGEHQGRHQAAGTLLSDNRLQHPQR